MPVLLLLGALAAVAVVAGVSSGGNADTLRKRLLGDKPTIHGVGGTVVPRTNPFIGSSATQFPGGVPDPVGASTTVLSAISNAAQSSFSSGAAPAEVFRDASPVSLAPAPSASPSPTPGPAPWDPIVRTPDISAPPTNATPQVAPPERDPVPTITTRPVNDAPPWSPPPPPPTTTSGTLFGPAPGVGYTGPDTWYGPATGVGYTVPTVAPFDPTGPSYDPGLYTAPNAGVSVTAPPGGGGGNTAS